MDAMIESIEGSRWAGVKAKYKKGGAAIGGACMWIE